MLTSTPDAAPAEMYSKKLTTEEFEAQAKINTINQTIDLCETIARKKIKKEDEDKFLKYFERKYSDECLIDTSTLSNDLERYMSIFKEINEKLEKDNKILEETIADQKIMLRESNDELDEVESKYEKLGQKNQQNKIRINRLRSKCMEKNAKIKNMGYFIPLLLLNCFLGSFNENFNIVGIILYYIFYLFFTYLSLYLYIIEIFVEEDTILSYVLYFPIFIAHFYYICKYLYKYNKTLMKKTN
jgi:hypothetical protein